MKTAIIADIHGNLQALQAVLRRIDEAGVDEIVCLGDIVGYGADPNACCDLVRSSCRTVVLGNHDEWVLRVPDRHLVPEAVWQSIRWTGLALDDRHKDYFSSLPLLIHRDERIYVHASPRHPGNWEYITDERSAARFFPAIGRAWCFVGHSHLPGIFPVPLNSAGTAADNGGGGGIVNAGSVGQPRDGVPSACFALVDQTGSETRSQIVRVEYNIALAAAKIVESGLPEYFARRLAFGR